MSHYEELEVSQNASDEEIKRSYKKLVLKHHPDKGGEDEKFRKIKEAYDVIGNTENRKIYDEQIRFGSKFSTNHTFPVNMMNHIFSSININNIFPPVRNHFGSVGKDIVYTIVLTKKEVEAGYKKSLPIKIIKRCFNCIETCFVCNGSGFVKRNMRLGFMETFTQTFCDRCESTGDLNNPTKNNCTCQDGKIITEEILELHVPTTEYNPERIYFIDFVGFGEQPKKNPGKAGNLRIQFKFN